MDLHRWEHIQSHLHTNTRTNKHTHTYTLTQPSIPQYFHRNTSFSDKILYVSYVKINIKHVRKCGQTKRYVEQLKRFWNQCILLFEKFDGRIFSFLFSIWFLNIPNSSQSNIDFIDRWQSDNLDIYIVGSNRHCTIPMRDHKHDSQSINYLKVSFWYFIFITRFAHQRTHSWNWKLKNQFAKCFFLLYAFRF